MDPELKALVGFIGIMLAWVAIPVLPAWLTFRITPDQRLGLRGPFQGLTLQTGGAFSAYLVVLMLISLFVWRVGTGIMGRMMNAATWTVSGKVRIYDAEGAPAASPPDITRISVRMTPEPHLISPDSLVLRLPFKDYEKPVIYLDIPNWGGGRIVLSDSSAYDENPLTREILLRDYIVLREKPRTSSTIGPDPPREK